MADQGRPEPAQHPSLALQDAARAHQSPAERYLCPSLGYPSAIEPWCDAERPVRRDAGSPEGRTPPLGAVVQPGEGGPWGKSQEVKGGNTRA